MYNGGRLRRTGETPLYVLYCINAGRPAFYQKLLVSELAFTAT
jgi:hypothetical protein